MAGCSSSLSYSYYYPWTAPAFVREQGSAAVVWERPGASAGCIQTTTNTAEIPSSIITDFHYQNQYTQILARKDRRVENKFYLPFFSILTANKFLLLSALQTRTNTVLLWKTTNLTLTESSYKCILQVPSRSCELILSHSTCYLTNKGGAVFLLVRKMPPKADWGRGQGNAQEPRFAFLSQTIIPLFQRPILLNELQDLPFPAAATQLQCTAQCFCCSNSLGGVWNANISSHIDKVDSKRKRIKAFRSEWHVLLTCSYMTV